MLGLLPFIPPFAPLYAETHYRFKYFVSFLSKQEPEVLADAPHRVEPGESIPILLLAKDAHVAPAELLEVVAKVRTDQEEFTIPLTKASITLRDQWWWTICEVSTDGLAGWVEIDVQFTLRSVRGLHSYATDNYRTSAHTPLNVYVAREPLPRLPGLMLGEGHSHSNATCDQVEFGIPPAAARGLGRRLGLDFACITDHSYDLDDRVDDYLVNDPHLPKWRALIAEIAELNSGPGMILVAGEEVTCRNREGRNIHCLVLGDAQYHPGSGDSAERWLKTRSELSLADLIARTSPDAAIVGAHVREHVPLLQRLLLGRGRWEDDDIGERGLHALQFWNGEIDDGFAAGKRAWIRALLQGHRLAVAAGNDAHGNFNRFRQLSVPFLLLRDDDHQLFGRVRMGVFSAERSERAIIEAIRKGRTISTDGPIIAFYDGDRAIMGSILTPPASLRLEARSSHEFGGIDRVEIWMGVIGADHENLAAHWDGSGSMTWHNTFEAVDRRSHYVRAELITRRGDRDGHVHRALTSPVWLGE